MTNFDPNRAYDFEEGNLPQETRDVYTLAEAGDAQSAFALYMAYTSLQPNNANNSFDKKYILKGLHRNENAVIYWLQKSAYEGYPDAESALSAIYAFGGYSLPKNIALSLYWNNRSANDGNINAEKYRYKSMKDTEGMSDVLREEYARGFAKQDEIKNKLDKILETVVINSRKSAAIARAQIVKRKASELMALKKDLYSRNIIQDPTFYIGPRDVDSTNYKDQAIGCIFVLPSMKVLQKLPTGYLLQFIPPPGPMFRTGIVYVDNNDGKVDLPENAYYQWQSIYAICDGYYDYKAIDGYDRRILKFKLLQNEAIGIVINRIDEIQKYAAEEAAEINKRNTEKAIARFEADEKAQINIIKQKQDTKNKEEKLSKENLAQAQQEIHDQDKSENGEELKKKDTLIQPALSYQEPSSHLYQQQTIDRSNRNLVTDQASAQRTYIVQGGESLESIAAVYGTTVDAIKALNEGVDLRILHQYQIIVIP